MQNRDMKVNITSILDNSNYPRIEVFFLADLLKCLSILTVFQIDNGTSC